MVFKLINFRTNGYVFKTRKNIQCQPVKAMGAYIQIIRIKMFLFRAPFTVAISAFKIANLADSSALQLTLQDMMVVLVSFVNALVSFRM